VPAPLPASIPPLARRCAQAALTLLVTLAITATASATATGCGKDHPRAAPDHDRSADLVAIVEAMLRDAKRGDTAALERRARSFALRDPARWFTTTFGPAGEALARDYGSRAPALGDLAAVFRDRAAAGQTQVTVERFTDPGDDAATGYQAAALSAMQHPVALYSVRLIADGSAEGYHLWSFVWADGGFRWVGKLRELGTPGARVDGIDVGELRRRDASLFTPR
jgi:hypothetical protein